MLFAQPGIFQKELLGFLVAEHQPCSLPELSGGSFPQGLVPSLGRAE